MVESVRLAELTWPEVETALAEGVDTVIIGVGAIEQHGPHLPLLVDTLTSDVLAGRVAEELGNALAAPTVRPGCSAHHMDFPGTLTISEDLLTETLRAYCESLDSHGFAHLVLLPTHGGNFAAVEAVTPELDSELDATVSDLADLDLLMELMNAGLRDAGIAYHEPAIHAGAAETALVLAVAEGMVRTDALEPGYEGEVSVEEIIESGFRTVTETGVLGDPREATAKAGEAILDRIVDAYVEAIESERR